MHILPVLFLKLENVLLYVVGSLLQEVEVGLRANALRLLCEASRKADEEVQSFARDFVETSSVTETYMALANFCDKLLRDEEQSDTSEPCSFTVHCKSIHTCLTSSLFCPVSSVDFIGIVCVVHLYSTHFTLVTLSKIQRTSIQLEDK